MYEWKPIRDYEVDPNSLKVVELESLELIWKEQRHGLEKLDEMTAFCDRLNREWAIETGLLERIYSLDRGVTVLLLEEGIDASLIPHGASDKNPELVAAIINDQKDTIEGLFDFVKGNRELSTSYIKELHAQLTRNQKTTTAIDQFGHALEIDLISGDYKKTQNNPSRNNGIVFEYCPPEQVASEMDRLLELHYNHITVRPEVEAAWLHHRFTQIHPFQDGNGRVARALATLVFIKAGWFPLVIRDVATERNDYISSLESADKGDLKPLIQFFASNQRKSFVQALGISSQIKKKRQVELEISLIREKFIEREKALQKDWQKSKETAKYLQDYTDNRFKEIAVKLKQQWAEFIPNFDVFSDSSPDGEKERDFWFKSQIVEAANALGYFANTREYRAWTRLVLKSDSRSEILISFHAAGFEFRGILAVSACYFSREETEDNERQIGNITMLSDEFFQINYLEKNENTQSRFETWLGDVLLKGINIFHTRL